MFVVGVEDRSEEGDVLLLPSGSRLTGTVWTALAHIITGVIGAGVLSLSWSVAQLGWIAGPCSLIVFALIALVNASLLSNVHRYSDPCNGVTIINGSYLQAVQNILGNSNGWVCALLVYFNLFKLGVVYTITSAISIRAIEQSNCYHKHGHEAACVYGQRSYMLIFGIVQMVASQIPNFRNTKWLSVIAATMSFVYSLIGSGLGLAQTIGNGKIKGSIGGVPTATPAQKAWLVAQAIGDIAFAYPFALIFLEIQNTLKSPPPEQITMKKASRIAVFTATVFYLCCGGFGYAAFGNSTPGNLLMGFGFYEPYWLIDLANACVVMHLIGGYQVNVTSPRANQRLPNISVYYGNKTHEMKNKCVGLLFCQIFSQTLYAIAERWYAEKYPESGFISDFPSLKNPLRLCFRTLYVISTTAIAMLFPYFNEVVAFAGSVTFWPLIIYFPVEMYFVQKKIVPWTAKWVVLRIYTIVCLFVAIFALLGSIEGLIAKKIG